MSNPNHRRRCTYRLWTELRPHRLPVAIKHVARFAVRTQYMQSEIEQHVEIMGNLGAAAEIPAMRDKLKAFTALGANTDCIIVLGRGRRHATEQVVGICVLCGVAAGRAYAKFFHVVPAFSGASSKLPGVLLREAERVCRAAGCQYLESDVEVGTPEMHTFARCGYVVPARVQCLTHDGSIDVAEAAMLYAEKHNGRLPPTLQNSERNAALCLAATIALHVDRFDAALYGRAFPTLVHPCNNTAAVVWLARRFQ